MESPPGRLLRLLSLLQSRSEISGPELGEHLGVSTRTVRRDIDRLRTMGYPVDSAVGINGSYRLAAGAEVPPMLFDRDEVVSLTVALRRLHGSGIGPMLSLIHISEPTRLLSISYAVFCLKNKNKARK